ncbi:MAG: hypothetical protein JSV20_02610 [Candidatus Bathyarchaeota archaeon]|nr:MAG: hypothetical protein JSV20_02610 [Candidatus Bathyarchaeota archaeon]
MKIENQQKEKNIQFILAGVILSSLSLGLTETILPLYADSVNVPLAQMGFIFAFSPLISSFFQFFMSSLSDKYGRKAILLANRVSSAFTIGLTPLATRTVSLTALRFLDSISARVIVSPLRYENSEGEKRIRFLSIERSLSTVVMAGAMIISGYLLMNFNFLFVFAMASLMQVISFLLASRIKETFFLKKPKTFRTIMTEIFSVREIKTDVRRISASQFFVTLAMSFGEGFILILFLNNVLKAPPLIIGLTRAGAYVLYAVPTLFFSKLVLSWMRTWSNSKVYAASFIIASIFMFLIGHSFDPFHVFIFYSLFGIVRGFAILPQMAFMSSNSEGMVGKSFGLFRLVGSIGSLLGGLVAPVMASIYGFRLLFTISAFLNIITIIPIIIKHR